MDIAKIKDEYRKVYYSSYDYWYFQIYGRKSGVEWKKHRPPNCMFLASYKDVMDKWLGRMSCTVNNFIQSQVELPAEEHIESDEEQEATL